MREAGFTPAGAQTNSERSSARRGLPEPSAKSVPSLRIRPETRRRGALKVRSRAKEAWPGAALQRPSSRPGQELPSPRSGRREQSPRVKMREAGFTPAGAQTNSERSSARLRLARAERQEG